MTLRRRQALCTALLLLDEEEEIARRNRAKRSIWVKPWLQRRAELGVYNNLFQELIERNSLKDYIRMDRMHFYYLVERLYPYLLKDDTILRESIKPAAQVCVFLRYVASGETFRSLEYQFRISRRSIARIVDRVAEAIIEEMQGEYLKTPNTASKWLEIWEKFSQRWIFPNTIGAIDGKHIVLKQQRSNSGSHYRNYKGSDSIILLAVVGPEYEFLYAEVGMNGRNSDGGAWAQSPLKMALEDNTLNIPKPTPLSDGMDIPYVLVGDDAFPLSHYMMKPYPQKNLCSDKRIFNYRLSRARRISENAFGILANRWRVFRKPFLLKPEKVKLITYSCLILHNFLRSESTSGKIYIPLNLLDFEDMSGNIPGAWRIDVPKDSWLDLEPPVNRNPSRQAKDVREEFKRFFMNEGTVPWQWRAAQVEH